MSDEGVGQDRDGTRDRARGALLGLACGDAVGTTLEFAAPGSFAPVTDMVGGGPFALEPGQWTDDTSMALCLAESIIDTGTLDPEDQMRRYLLWRDEGHLSSNGRCFDMGGTISAALDRFARTGEALDPDPDPERAANGSLMRLAPVPIAWFRDVADAAVRSGRSSRTTHGAPRPVDACRLMGAMVAALIAGEPAEVVLSDGFWSGVDGPDAAAGGALHPQVEAIARGSYRAKAPPEVRGSGFCIDALEAALWAVAGADDFRDAVLRAANLGDDADTTAAIAGQLAGARWGASGIPMQWRERVTMGERIVSMADRLHDLQASGPGAHPGRWALDEHHHAWWVDVPVVLAGEYPTDPFGGTAAIELLLDAGVRTFLDLTEADEGLTPYRDGLVERAAARGLEVRHERRAIPDLGVVALEDYEAIVGLIESETGSGRTVYVHCWGGVGRTGTVVGCYLARDGGVTHDELLDRLAAARAGTRKAHRRSPETDVQRALLAAWCAQRP